MGTNSQAGLLTWPVFALVFNGVSLFQSPIFNSCSQGLHLGTDPDPDFNMPSQIPPGADLSKLPSGEPPPGVVPQFDNPPTALTGTLIGICAFLITWGTCFAAIRIWVNRRKLGVADGKHQGFGKEASNN
jgi:hypothetical protein